MQNTIHEVLEYGPIVASDLDLDLLLTVNGAYFNLWVGDGSSERFTNTDAFYMPSRVSLPDGNEPSDGLYGLDITKVITAGEELLREIVEGDDEDGEEE